MTRASQRGMTLIEVVVATTIIAAVGGTLVGLVSMMSRQSAEAMTASQRASIANAYLQEIMSRSFVCTNPSPIRTNFDCVDDYVLDETPTDRFGNAVPNSGGYRVQTFVFQSGIAAAAPYGATGSADVRRVVVRVTDPFGDWTTLSGIKLNHP